MSKLPGSLRYSKFRIGVFWRFGVSGEVGMYTDINKRESRLVLTLGAGAGYGVRISGERGIDTGDLPNTGTDVRARIRVGVGVGVSVEGQYNLTPKIGRIGGKVKVVKGEISSRLDRRVAIAPSLGAEASATVNRRIVFKLRRRRPRRIRRAKRLAFLTRD